MSDEKKEENWEQKIQKIVETSVSKALEEKLKPQSLPSSPSPEQKKGDGDVHTHWKAEDYKDSCPECKAEKEKIGKAYMKKTLAERKDLELACKECGTPVKREEEACPTCGSKDAKRR